MADRKNTASSATATEWGGAADPGSVSSTLRDARQRLGIELRDAASMLRIRYPYLQAIENGRYDELPGAAYATGFLRSYAEFLGLDPDTILRRYKDEAAGRAGKQELYFPTPVPEGRVPGGTVLLATLVIAGLVYGAWYYLSATDRSVADMVPVLPDRLVSLLDNLPWSSSSTPSASPAGEPAAAAAPSTLTLTPPPPPAIAPPAPPPVSAPPTPAPPAAAAPTPPAPPVSAPLPPRPPALPPLATPSAAAIAPPPPPPPAASQAEEEEVDMARQDPTPLSPTAAAPTNPQAPAAPADANAKVYGAQNGVTRVQVRAIQDSWVQIRDQQDIIFTRVLKPGDIYRVPDRPGVRLRTGNAGGLVVVTDGVSGQPMGAVGQVLRDVPLDAKPAR